MPIALIVDDEAEGLYFLQCLLSANGFEVVTASNGKQALEQAEQTLPDLVISDILMPGMDGFTFCRSWKQHPRFKSIPFFFYTATYTDAVDEEFALNLGADRFIVKPKEPGELLQIIRDFMDKQEPGKWRSTSIPAFIDESTYLLSYNSALIRKLENKVTQLEEANRALMIKDFAIATSIAGIVLADMSGIITYANSSFAKMWGYECAELEGMPLKKLIEDEALISSVLEILREKGHWLGELKAGRRGESPLIFQVAAHTVTGLDKKPVSFMASCIEISEHKRLQEELRRSQNLEALSLFAAGIAHDFNNLLTGLFNSLELAREQLQADSPAQREFSVALSVFERARGLTQNLLTFARGGSGVRHAVNVASIIRESCMLSLGGSGIRHEISAEENLDFVEANADQLSQVFTNIILNARQAMADNGFLTIKAENHRLEEGQVGDLQEGQYVAIRFKDTGPGISEKVMPKIFNPFFSTKQKGSGLGLATSYSIIKDHGGHIQAASGTGGGAEFVIWLPAHTGEKEESFAEADLKSVAGSGRILVMDDEECIRSIAQTMLERAGYEVTLAADGREAVSLYREALFERAPYDLAILDLTVRGGVGGEEALAELFKLNPRAAVIASSGYSNNAALPQFKQMGFAGTLPKPYTRYELLSLVKSTISKTEIGDHRSDRKIEKH